MTPPRGSRGLDDEIYARRRRKRKRMERKSTRRRAAVLAVAAVLGLLFVVAGAAVTSVATFGSSCDLNSLQQVEIGSNTFIYAADNSRLGVIPAERNRQPVPFKRISAWMPKATVAIEDRRFYQHDGVDVEGIARALWKNVSAGQVVEGGSTITQQLVRNLYIGREQTVERKLKEACLALKLDRAWEKNRILATYMNQVYYGNLAYGIEAAAQTYFSKHASELNLPEAALLAGLPQAPSVYNPFQREQVAKARRDQVLRALLTEGDITQTQYEWAVSRGLGLKAGKLYKEIREPDFFGYVRDQLIAEYGAGTVRSGGLKVYTTIDPRFQRAAQKAIRDTLYLPDDPAAGVISINPKNGAIRAMTAGAVLGLAGNLAYALSTSVVGLFVGQALTAGIWACVGALGVSIAQRLYPEGVGTASGIFLSAIPVGSAIGGTIGGIGVAAIGLPHVFFIPAVLTSLAIVAFVVLGNRENSASR